MKGIQMKLKTARLWLPLAVMLALPSPSITQTKDANKIYKVAILPFMIHSQENLDYLPLPQEDLSVNLGNEFSIAGQLSDGTANVIREKELNAVFLDYYGCGPNSFLKTFFVA
jgi:hypothetical protein